MNFVRYTHWKSKGKKFRLFDWFWSDWRWLKFGTTDFWHIIKCFSSANPFSEIRLFILLAKSGYTFLLECNKDFAKVLPRGGLLSAQNWQFNSLSLQLTWNYSKMHLQKNGLHDQKWMLLRFMSCTDQGDLFPSPPFWVLKKMYTSSFVLAMSKLSLSHNAKQQKQCFWLSMTVKFNQFMFGSKWKGLFFSAWPC